MHEKMLRIFVVILLSINGLVIPTATGEFNFNSRYGQLLGTRENSSELPLDPTLNSVESAQVRIRSIVVHVEL